MKVWLENKKKQEREIDERELIKEFIKARNYNHPIERDLSSWLMNEAKIENKWFVYEGSNFEKLLKIYFELKQRGQNGTNNSI